MTLAKTVKTTVETAAKTRRPIAFPYPPERRPEDMTSFKQLGITGSAHYLAEHLGHPETTIVTSERYITIIPVKEMGGQMLGLRYPDLLVAFNVDPDAFNRDNAYVIREQGKPPDFVLEIASPSSRRRDVRTKRAAYAELEIPEYWRFDELAEDRHPKLAGDRLAGRRYRPLPVEQLPDGVVQGYSPALDLHLRWEEGRLVWHDPATGRPIATMAEEREGRAQAEARADVERGTRILAEDLARSEAARARGEQEARAQAEAYARSEQEARIRSDERARNEQEARIRSEERARREQEARARAEERARREEARARELEAELRRLRGE